MRLRCYLQTDWLNGRQKHCSTEIPSSNPQQAAETYMTWLVNQNKASPAPHDVVVEPADDDARALVGWKIYDTKSQYLTYRVSPRNAWAAVAT